MNKQGQIFSVDLIISLIIMIIFLSIILNATQERAYEKKEQLIYSDLINKLDSGFVALTNGNYSCDSNGLKLAFSLDKSKLNAENELKRQMGLLDLNTYLSVDSEIIINNQINGDFIVSLDKNILICENGIDRNSLLQCVNGNCSTEKKRIILKVSK